jgi:class 3 adenylate cyclase/predicted ATPase
MFCDLVGSSALAERLDPEDLRDLLAAYQDTCAGEIGRYEGFIARYVGDGLLVYFGYPSAHEDDATRAVRAGLGIAKAMDVLNASMKWPDVKLAVRIGITTGLVVVGDIGTGGRVEHKAVVGETPNIAARLQTVANPGTVVIGAPTMQLIDGLFDCEELGPKRLKGVSQPVAAYLVRRDSRAPSRFEASAARGLTAFVGRQAEVGLLLQRWEQAVDRDSQIVLLAGEAGIGKSRIVRGFRDRLQGRTFSHVLYYCSPYYQNSAFHPVVEQCERVLRFERSDGTEAKLDKIESLLADLGLPVAELAPLFASFLSVPAENRYPPIGLGPEQLKRKIIEMLVAIVEAMAARQPVLMVVEDAHWLDPSSIEFLSLLIERLRATRLLLVVVFRPEFTPPWTGYAPLTSLTLNRLSRRESAALIVNAAAGKALPDEVTSQIIDRADGIPLFIEEVTKVIVESGMLRDAGDRYELSGPLPELTIPASLHDSLMARLDRLAPVKEVAQLAASLGRNFSHELLVAVSPLKEADLEGAILKLVEAELIYRRGVPPDATYEFKHALVQDAAYQSLLKSTRQQYHRRIARVLTEQFGDIADGAPELVAHHFTQAGLAEQAAEYWQLAGQSAIERSANPEAVDHLRRALAEIESLAETPERIEQRIRLQIMLAVPLTATSGYAAPEVAKTYNEARELCQRIGTTAQLFPAMYGLWRFYLLRAEYATARELGDELLRLAERTQAQRLLIAAHRAVGATLFYLGDIVQSRAHLDHVIGARADAGPSCENIYDVVDAGVASRAYAAWGEWLLGHPDKAVALSDDAVALARELDHPFSKALASSFAAWLHQFRRDRGATEDKAKSALAVATEQGFPFWIGWDDVLCGWVLAGQDHEDMAITRMREGLACWRATGSELGWPYFLALLAEVYGDRSRTEDALELIDEADAFVDKTAERWWQADLCRLRGELLLKAEPANVDEAQSCFERALDIARAQQARSLELRAAVSLGRLWHAEGKSREARELLSGIYGWFTEGFDTADLEDARTLLAQLE